MSDDQVLDDVRAMLKEKANFLESKSVDEIFAHINREDDDSLALLRKLKDLAAFRASSMSRGGKKVIR